MIALMRSIQGSSAWWRFLLRSTKDRNTYRLPQRRLPPGLLAMLLHTSAVEFAEHHRVRCLTARHRRVRGLTQGIAESKVCPQSIAESKVCPQSIAESKV